MQNVRCAVDAVIFASENLPTIGGRCGQRFTYWEAGWGYRSSGISGIEDHLRNHYYIKYTKADYRGAK